jgi:acyl-CoA thioester hydrolase
MAPGRQSHSEVRVRYAETDQMGVVYHANYLAWCEIGRTDWIRALGVTYAEMERGGVRLAVAEAGLRYHAPARYDDRVHIVTTLESARSRAVVFVYRLTRPAGTEGEEVLLVSARTTLVATDAEGRVRALPPELLQRFREEITP